jgi:hypothetical protein
MRELSAVGLAGRAFNVMQDVLIHQRSRWAHLLLHRHQYEGWWKAELRSALDGWCCQIPSMGSVGVLSEVKPKSYGVGNTNHSFDLVIGLKNPKTGAVDLGFGPRIWIELKERGTWWGGNAAKAFGEGNSGVRTDLKKWRAGLWSADDVLAACQIITHRGNALEILPAEWKRELDSIAKTNPRCVPTRSVGCPSWNSNEVLWTTMEFFQILPPRRRR